MGEENHLTRMECCPKHAHTHQLKRGEILTKGRDSPKVLDKRQKRSSSGTIEEKFEMEAGAS
jgi:hypothetical protein